MPQITGLNFKKRLISAIVLVLMIAAPPAPAWADGTSAIEPTVSTTTTPVDTPLDTSTLTLGEPQTTPETQNLTPAVDSDPPAALNAPVDNAETTLNVPEVCPVPSTEGVQESAIESLAPSSTPSASATQDDTTYLTANNNLCSTATSGDAAVTTNGSVDNTTTGDAQSSANLVNLLQSFTSLGGGSLATFSADINGDVFGDLYIDPIGLGYLQSALGQGPNSGNINLELADNSQINNSIILDANSGNAVVSYNGLAGNVTTGDAQAILKLVNIINSIVASGKSFVGMVNIYGNLDGDILFPPDLISSLLAAGALNANGSGATKPPKINADFDTTQTINNNVSLNATSGAGDILSNGSVGNIATGNAATELTILNLTNRQIICDDALLVFVNVMGQWVGLIVDAPPGATSATLGVAAGGSCLSAPGFKKLALEAESSAEINNNIDANAKSGDALVSYNGAVGNVATGDAKASVSMVNIINNVFSLTDWFGILFINVFGSWNGSFGIDTAAGELPASPPPAGSTSQPPSPAVLSSSYRPRSHVLPWFSHQAASAEPEIDSGQGNVLGSFGGYIGPRDSSGQPSLNLWPTLAAGVLCCALLAGIKRRKEGEPELIQTAPEIVYPTV